MGGYYTPKMKEIKEVMVPPLVHLSQTAPYRGALAHLKMFFVNVSVSVCISVHIIDA